MRKIPVCGKSPSETLRVLNEKGRIIRVTAAYFQEQRITPPGGAKRQCLEPFDHLDEDFDLPFRIAWFNNPDIQDLCLETATKENQQPVYQTPFKSRQHEPSEIWKRDFNLRS